jgi:uncharacterized protein YlbG (UPF0298 family)
MKTFLTLLIIFICNFSSHAQLVKKKTKKIGDYQEVFYVNRKTKMPHGYYNKTHLKTNIKAVSGEFVKGMRHGKWIYKDGLTGEKIMEYDFSNNSLSYLNPEYKTDSFLIKSDNSFVYAKVDRPLVFIGYNGEENDILKYSIDIPQELKQAKISGTCYIQYLVNEKGDIEGNKVLESFDDEINNKVNEIVNSFNGRFLPAISEGNPVPSVFFVKITVREETKAITVESKELPYVNDVLITYRPVSNIVHTPKNYFSNSIPGHSKNDENNK